MSPSSCVRCLRLNAKTQLVCTDKYNFIQVYYSHLFSVSNFVLGYKLKHRHVEEKKSKIDIKNIYELSTDTLNEQTVTDFPLAVALTETFRRSDQTKNKKKY